MDQSTSPLARITKSCMSRFETLLARNHNTVGRYKLLESRQADFNLWADSVGALAKPGASLDSRLKGRAKDIALVNNVLFMLDDSLEYCAELSESDGNYDEAIQNLDSAIRNLALIGAAIRRTGKASRNRRANRTFDPDIHQDFRQHLECVVLLRPTEDGLFRQREDGQYEAKLNSLELSNLQARLIEANLRRRHNFLVAQRQSRAQDVLNIKSFTLAVLPGAGELPQTPPTDVDTDRGHRTPDSHEPLPESTTETAKPTAPTITGFSRASTAEGSLNYTPKMAKTQITSIASNAEFPRSPATSSNQEISKCPCCCQALPIEIFCNPKAWK